MWHQAITDKSIIIMRRLLLIAHLLFLGIVMSAGYSRVAEERVTGFIATEGYDDLLTDGSDHRDSKAYGADDGTQRKAGLTGQQPRMPETAPARRSVTSSADHQRGSSTARHTPQLPAALTPAQPLHLASSSCHGYWILISGTPVMWTRAGIAHGAMTPSGGAGQAMPYTSQPIICASGIPGVRCEYHSST